jgi:hypothetical protein
VKTVQAAFLAALILAIGLAVRPTGAAAVSTGACVDLTVGPPQEAVSDARRDALGLAGWPDGTLGMLPRADGTYDFYAMDAFGGSGPYLASAVPSPELGMARRPPVRVLARGRVALSLP